MEGVDVGKALNDLARHQMVRRIYLDILVDLTVCRESERGTGNEGGE